MEQNTNAKIPKYKYENTKGQNTTAKIQTL